MIRISFIIAATAISTAAMAVENAPADGQPAARAPVVQDCLITRNIAQTQAGYDGKWYARLRDRSWWRNSMECPGLAPRRAVVHTSPIGSQCRGDVVQIVDFTMGGVFFGGCGLGSWERMDGPPPRDQPPKRDK